MEKTEFSFWHYLALVTLLMGLIMLPLVKQVPTIPVFATLGIAVIASCGFVFIYCRKQLIKTYLTYLSLAALVFPLWFLLGTQVRSLIFSQEGPVENYANNGTPIVLIIFDEIPLTSLMTIDKNIDAQKFPNFASLAATSHWFRNASTVSYFTNIAVPAILSGKYPHFVNGVDDKAEAPLPTKNNFPNNIFSLVQTDYQINAFESTTELAPEQTTNLRNASLSAFEKGIIFWLDTAIVYLNIVMPEKLIPKLPDLDGQWTDFANLANLFDSDSKDSPQRGREWRVTLIYKLIGSIKKSDTPQLFVLHTLLPHMPYVYLPSGKYYGPEEAFPHGLNSSFWENDSWEAAQGYQRHILQLGYVDQLLGEIIYQLKIKQLFDKSIFIVTGDHGESFKEGTAPRAIREENLQDTLLVPLFVKLPFQNTPVISDRNVETIDILPTIANLIESENDWNFDGQNLFGDLPEKTNKTVHYHTGDVRTFEPEFPGLVASLQHKAALFGEEGMTEVLSFGPNNHLLMREMSSLTVDTTEQIFVAIENSGVYRFVDLEDDYLPVHLKGSLQTETESEPLNLAISLNGTIAAVTRTYEDEDTAGNFTAILPESLFQSGVNRIEVYIVEEQDASLVLQATLQRKSR